MRTNYGAGNVAGSVEHLPHMHTAQILIPDGVWWFTSAILALQEVEAKGSEIQGHTQSHTEAEASLVIEDKLID